jgi:sulfur carrier protein
LPIHIYVNGQARTLAESVSLIGLLEDMGLSGKRIAIEVNQEIIPRTQHAGYKVADGDRVEIVQAIGGG